MFDNSIPAMTLDSRTTALVFTDLHNDFLAKDGKAYALISESLAENNTAEKHRAAPARSEDRRHEGLRVAARLLSARPRVGGTDHSPGGSRAQDWTPEPQGSVSLDGFAGSGADFPDRYKPYLDDPNTVVTSPHKAYGASSNDMILQLRRYRIEKIVLAGPVGNLCVEAHMRDFIEHGFEVAMVRDATAGARNEEGDGYRAALVNWRFMAHALWSTAETVGFIAQATAPESDSRFEAARSAGERRRAAAADEADGL